ncbi:MAG: hypothetical protein KDE55_18940 [Novosphingobium sp.]|nr:hypothetical protein [Novosphingobium sp.]
MKWQRLIGIVLPTAAAISAAYPLVAQQKPASGPIARYDMRAGTVSGFGGGGRGGALGMMFGGGQSANVQHELYLRLGSSQSPVKGNPKADHFMPPGVKVGKSVALVTPREEPVPDQLPQKPKGRLLIFWGCGEHVTKGQPVVIDFAKVAAGQVPPGLWTSTILRDWGPDLHNSRTFGRWPAEDGKYVKADSSLPGPHRVVANYGPEIAFTLARDFMAPLSVRTASTPTGATLASWTGIAGSTGYLVGLFGGKQGPGGEMGDMVMWTSSATRQFGGGLADWLSPGQVAQLVKDKTVLPPTATTCTIPAEVNAAAPDFRVGTLTAFGPEEDFSYPPRPTDARTPWNLEWTARIRHRSTTSWMQMQGMSMGSMGAQGASQPPAECKRKGGLGGMLGGVLGSGSGC